MMNTENKLKAIFIIVAAAVLINALLLVLILRPDKEQTKKIKPQPTVSTAPIPSKHLAAFSFQPQKLQLKTNQTAQLTLKLHTPDRLLGADAALLFDPRIIKIEEITAGEMFPRYPRINYDNQSGKIIITGLNLEDSLPATNNFAALTLRAKSPGTASIKFDFTYQKTDGSNAIRASDQKNILTHTKNVMIKIQDKNRNQ